MNLNSSDIINSLLSDVEESKIAPPPDDPLSFAEMLEKEAAGQPAAPPSRSMEEIAKIAVAQEILSNHIKAVSDWSSIFSNPDAILPDITDAEKSAAMLKDDICGIDKLASMFSEERSRSDAEIVKLAYSDELKSIFRPELFTANPGRIGRYVKSASGLSGLNLKGS